MTEDTDAETRPATIVAAAGTVTIDDALAPFLATPEDAAGHMCRHVCGDDTVPTYVVPLQGKAMSTDDADRIFCCRDCAVPLAMAAIITWLLAADEAASTDAAGTTDEVPA